MNALKRLQIEIDGIDGTIRHYTSNPYLLNTLKQLKVSIYEKEIDEIAYLLNIIDEWYRENLSEIKSNQFVSNYNEHQKVSQNVKVYLEELPLLKNEIRGKSEEDILGKGASKKIFISHSSKDKTICSAFVELLESIGVPEKMILYSSSPRHGIPGDEDIFEYLREHISNDINVFYMLSDNYYSSVYCLNEMGAAWLAQSEYSIFILPSFKGEVLGVLDSKRKGYSLSEPIELLNLKNKIVRSYDLTISEAKWEEVKNRFIKQLNE